jgi:hypothetical protein
MNASVPKGKKGSIRNQLLSGVLVLALVPLVLLAITGYQIASNSLRDAAIERLQETSRDQRRFLRNWFDYRFMDLDRLATDPTTSKLLMELTEDFLDSDDSPVEYVKTYDWEVLVGARRAYFFNQWLTYDYVYDIFLVDLEGNILMTLAKESDLGTNLYTGPYAQTLFGNIVRKTLEEGNTEFSDFERYEPSANLLSAFFSAPVLDDNGLRIGALAMQVRLDRVHKSLLDNDNRTYTYLVGSDSLMRTAINDEDSEVLLKSIDTPLVKQWLENGQNTSGDDVYLKVGYTGPDNYEVIGVSTPVQIGSVK